MQTTTDEAQELYNAIRSEIFLYDGSDSVTGLTIPADLTGALAQYAGRSIVNIVAIDGITLDLSTRTMDDDQLVVTVGESELDASVSAGTVASVDYTGREISAATRLVDVDGVSTTFEWQGITHLHVFCAGGDVDTTDMALNGCATITLKPTAVTTMSQLGTVQVTEDDTDDSEATEETGNTGEGICTSVPCIIIVAALEVHVTVQDSPCFTEPCALNFEPLELCNVENSFAPVRPTNGAVFRKTFSLGPVYAKTGGEFRICYCMRKDITIAAKELSCLEAPHFVGDGGALVISGPNIDTEVTARVGVIFELQIYGSELTVADRAVVVPASVPCSIDLTADIHPDLVGNDLNVPNYTNGRQPTVTPDEKIMRWSDIVIYGGGVYHVCWCKASEQQLKDVRNGVEGATGCGDEGFPVRALILKVSGPPLVDDPPTKAVRPGEPFDMQLSGQGYQSTDRLAIVSNGDCVSGVVKELPNGDPITGPIAWPFGYHVFLSGVPSTVSANGATWQNIILDEKSLDGEYFSVCWCGHPVCYSPTQYRTLAHKITVTGAQWTEPATPSEQLYPPSTDGVPPPAFIPLQNDEQWEIPENDIGSINIEVTAATRAEPDWAGSTDGIDIFVCVSPTLCYGPSRINNHNAGKLVYKELYTGNQGSGRHHGLGAVGVYIRAAGQDSWFGEYIDIKIGETAIQRVSLNGWITRAPASVSLSGAEALPLPEWQASEIFLPLDFCGGCPHGSKCSIGYAIDSVYECQDQCGDGFTTGSEMCDDGNRAGGDGCSADCRVEEGFYCQLSVPEGAILSRCRPLTCVEYSKAPSPIDVSDIFANIGSDEFTCGPDAQPFDDASSICHVLDDATCQTESTAFSSSSSFFGCSANPSGALEDSVCGIVEKPPYPISAVYSYHGRAVIITLHMSLEVLEDGDKLPMLCKDLTSIFVPWGDVPRFFGHGSICSKIGDRQILAVTGWSGDPG